MLPSDIRNLHEAYQNIYEESDLLTDDLIEEIVEELVEECLEFGYHLDDVANIVEDAAIEYLIELNPYAPAGSKQARAYQKSTTATRRGEARKTAVKTAVSKVKAKAKGAVAAAGIAGSIAKDEARRAGRAAAHAVSSTVQKKKAEVKSGVKSLIGRGLRKAAGAVGKVAQKAAGAASRFGESVELGENRAMARDPEGRNSGHSKQPDPSKPGFTGIGNMSIAQIAKMSAKIGKDKKQNEEVEYIEERDEGKPGLMFKKIAKDAAERYGSVAAGNRVAGAIRKKVLAKEEVEIYDVVLEYLMSEGHADTIAEAEYIMTELDSEMVDQIVETRLDPRGRPASGPMNVYANPKNKPSQAHLDAVKAYDEKQRKKTPEQRKAELDAYRARKEYS